MAQRTVGIRNRLASAIRERREELRLTQEAAAERCGLSARYWRDLEGSRRSVRLEVVERIVGGLGWSWMDLVGQIEPAQSGVGDAPAGAHRQLDAAWREGTSRERALITLLLRHLSRQ